MVKNSTDKREGDPTSKSWVRAMDLDGLTEFQGMDVNEPVVGRALRGGTSAAAVMDLQFS